MTKLLRFIKKIILYTVLIVVCFEAALWILGYRPYTNVDYKVESSPGNAFVGDSLLGIRLNPGVFDITLNDSVQFSTTHLENGQRLVPRPINRPEKALHFYGCSFTYGYGVNNDESFVAQIQKKFQRHKVYNHAVPGYGTVQSLMQLRNIEEYAKGDAVILCFSGHHFIRNTLSQEYRSRLKIGFENSSKNLEKQMNEAKFPMLKNCDSEITSVAWNTMYENWPGRSYSSGVNFLQSNFDHYQDSQVDMVKTTVCIIRKMAAFCETKGLKFALVCLDNNHKTTALKNEVSTIPWLDVGFDFSSALMTNAPYDSHPNTLGHAFIYQKIAPFLEGLFSK